ncbi:MAG TPA: sugar ABC transporter permease [Limnochordia bacterium]|nr:sugar ABC transporter permease [Limnochordia bacterium]
MPPPAWRAVWPHLEGYLYVLPAAAILFAFWLGPTLYTLWLSFHNANMILPGSRFVGLANYARMLGDARFWVAFWNTAVYVGVVVPLTAGTALVLAIALHAVRRGADLYRTLLFLPVVIGGASAAVLFKWLYAGDDDGFLNILIGLLGLKPHNWLLEPHWALPAVMWMGIWKHIGYDVILFYAGLQAIERGYYEAAQVDGAGDAAVVRYITIPLLAPVTFVVLVLEVIHSFQVFSHVFVLTQGGPIDHTLVMVYYLYTTAFGSFDFGYGSALSFALFLVILAATLVQRGLLESKIHYDG